MKYSKDNNSLDFDSPQGAIYNQEPVWVKSINLDKKTATIVIPTFGEPERTVMLNELSILTD